MEAFSPESNEGLRGLGYATAPCAFLSVINNFDNSQRMMVTAIVAFDLNQLGRDYLWVSLRLARVSCVPNTISAFPK